METDKTIATQVEARGRRWRRALRPLAWWLILILVLYTYRIHQRLIDQTRLRFSVAVESHSSNPFQITSRLDGIESLSGERVTPGWHTFSASCFNSETFSKRIFVWYGENDLGDIVLTRTKGTLLVTANPPAHTISIRGLEFNHIFTNVSGITSSIPTDRYVIEAQYQYGNYQEQTKVSSNSTATVAFAPKFGIAQLACNQSNATFEVNSSQNRIRVGGDFPAFLPELPSGNYTLLSRHGNNQREEILTVRSGETNRYRVEFLYGTAVIESKPPGVQVWQGQTYCGITPLILKESPIGLQEFTLRRDDYESSTVSLVVSANETNRVEKTLVSTRYKDAIQQARLFLAQKDYDVAKQSALEALKYEPDDTEAKFIERQARGLKHLNQAEAMGMRGSYVQAIEEANAAVSIMPDYEPAKVVLAELIKNKDKKEKEEKQLADEKAEQERKQQERALADRQAQTRIKELHNAFDVLLRGFANSAQFAEHELTTSNAVGVVGPAIRDALLTGQPSFKIIRFEQPRAEIFGLQARLTMFPGYRDCFLVGSQVREGETRILFKILEYETSPDVNILNAFVKLPTVTTSTPQDPNSIGRKQEQWNQRVLEGVKLVKGRIQAAVFERGRQMR